MKLSTIKDLNDISNGGVLLVALEIFIPDTPTVRVINNSERAMNMWRFRLASASYRRQKARPLRFSFKSITPVARCSNTSKRMITISKLTE